MRFSPFADWHHPRFWARWALAPLLALLMLLTACNGGGDDARVPPPQQARTTVLVYVVGSDLEGPSLNKDGTFTSRTNDAATKNIEEMMKVGSSQDVNIILETGGAKKAGWETVKRQRVVKGGLEVIADLGAQRMTDSANLRRFLEWGVATYPAQSYHLVFWNHGGGPLGGFGGDQNYPGGKDNAITTPQLAAALEGAQRTTGIRFDLIGFDACLMGSAEVGYMLRPYARYLVASEDIEPGEGWDWEAYLRHVADNPGSTALSTGKAIIDGYVAKMEKSGSTMVTLSLTDLAKTVPLMERLNDMAATIVGKLDDADLDRRHDAWADLAHARRRTHDFQTSWFYDNEYDLVDLADYVTMPNLASLGVSEAQVDAVHQALGEAVVYNKYGRRLWTTSGMTLYSPLVSAKKSSYLPYTDYAGLAVPDSLKALVQRYGDIANSPDLPAPALDVPTLDAGGILYTTLKNDRFSAVEYATLWEGDTRLAIKPLDADAGMPPAAPDERFIAADAYKDWFQVPSQDGTDVLVSVLPDDAPRFATGYAQYSIPVSREESDGSLSKGVLLVDYEEAGGDKTYRIVGFLGYTDASPYASRADSESLLADTVFYPMVWSTREGLWKEDTTRKIVSYAVGDENTPRDQWWQVGTVEAQTLCGSDCEVGFELVKFEGSIVQSTLKPLP